MKASGLALSRLPGCLCAATPLRHAQRPPPADLLSCFLFVLPTCFPNPDVRSLMRPRRSSHSLLPSHAPCAQGTPACAPTCALTPHPHTHPHTHTRHPHPHPTGQLQRLLRPGLCVLPEATAHGRQLAGRHAHGWVGGCEVWRGVAWRGVAWRGVARRGVAWHSVQAQRSGAGGGWRGTLLRTGTLLRNPTSHTSFVIGSGARSLVSVPASSVRVARTWISRQQFCLRSGIHAQARTTCLALTAWGPVTAAPLAAAAGACCCSPGRRRPWTGARRAS